MVIAPTNIATSKSCSSFLERALVRLSKSGSRSVRRHILELEQEAEAERSAH
jgi:hypothetical protein